MLLLKKFFTQEDGMGTVEIVILIAVLVIVALIFKDKIIKFINELLDKVLDINKITEEF
ncbi:MAG: Flp1 family type IVb pilin [Clostridiales bacterium]